MTGQEDLSLLQAENARLQRDLERTRELQEQAEFVFRLNPNPILIWNADLSIIDVNQAFIDATGWSREKTLDATLNDFVYLDRKGDGLAETVRDKTQKTGEATFRFPKGIVTWVRHTIPVLTSSGGIERIFSVYNDITGQRKQIDEIKILQDRTASIIAQNPYPIILWTPDLAIETMNLAALTLMGWNESDIKRLTIKDFDYISQTGQSVADTIRSKQGSSGEAVVRFPSGIKVLERHNIPLRDTNGNVYNVLTVYNDITNQKKAISEVIEVAKAAEQGDLTTRTHPDQFSGDYYELSKGINQVLDTIVTPLRKLIVQIEGISANAEEVASSVKEASAGTTALADNADAVGRIAEQGDDGVRQILRAMEDLTTTVSEIAVRSESVSKLAISAEDKSKTGVELATKTVTVMEGINQSTGEVNQIVLDIKTQMDQIGKIVTLITDIANQTNLLALNAAIEAARAGDAGRGFAVVASEVKSLAQDSRKSAENIAEMIHALQNKTEQATRAVDEAGNSVQEGNTALAETLAAFNTIKDSIEDISKNVVEVASLSEEQAASVEEISASIQEVSTLLQTAAKQAVDSAAATEEASAALDQIETAINDVSLNIDGVNQEMARFRT